MERCAAANQMVIHVVRRIDPRPFCRCKDNMGRWLTTLFGRGNMFRYLSRSVRWALIPSALAVATSVQAQRAGQPSVQDMLALRPTQRFVDYDMPTGDQLAGLKAELATEGKAKIWVLKDAAGRVYRRF